MSDTLIISFSHSHCYCYPPPPPTQSHQLIIHLDIWESCENHSLCCLLNTKVKHTQNCPNRFNTSWRLLVTEDLQLNVSNFCKNRMVNSGEEHRQICWICSHLILAVTGGLCYGFWTLTSKKSPQLKNSVNDCERFQENVNHSCQHIWLLS